MYLIVSLLMVILDQFTKFLASTKLPMGEPIPVLPPIVYFTYVLNPGAAFTIFANQRWLFISVATMVGLTAFLARKTLQRQTSLFKWGLTIALTGAAGNLIDRIRLGKVIDFVDMRVWPIFNVADSCIVIGVALMIWVIMRQPAKSDSTGV